MYGACGALVYEFQESYYFVLRHIVPVAWVASLWTNVLTHSIPLFTRVTTLMQDVASEDADKVYKVGYDCGGIFKILFD